MLGNIHSNQLNFHLETRIPWLNRALFSEVFFGLPLVGFLFAFHDDAGDLEMIRPAAEHDHFQELNHLHFRMVLSVISGMQGWYLAWLQDRFLSSVACNDEVSGDGEAVGRSFFCLPRRCPAKKSTF